jgi:uncharacterized protein (DUF1778 family)
MSNRTALLIYCSQDELARIRERAALEHRTVSGYVLNILMRAIAFEESLYAKLKPTSGLSRALATQAVCSPGPRTNMLLRCSEEEAERIRNAAKRRETTISGFVRLALRRSWSVAAGMLTPEKMVHGVPVANAQWKHDFTESARSERDPRRPQ